MKKIEFRNLPAGSIVLVKKYNLWERFKAWWNKKELPYNDAWVDPFGGSGFLFANTLWTKHDVFTFTPKKPYSNKEKIKMFEQVLVPSIACDDPVEILLKVNLVRPNTMQKAKQDDELTLEKLLDDNKYYNKNKIK